MASTCAAPACSSGSEHRGCRTGRRKGHGAPTLCTSGGAERVSACFVGEFMSSASDPEHGGPGEGLSPRPSRDGEIKLYKTSRCLHLLRHMTHTETIQCLSEVLC